MDKLDEIMNEEIVEKYSIDNNTFVQVVNNNPKDLIETEIGDIKQEEFYPQIKIKRWNNECNFSIRLVNDEINPVITTEGEIIKWKGDKLEVHFYDKPELEEGGYEFGVLLKDKPASNVINFTLLAKGLIFDKQLPLDKEKHGREVSYSTPTHTFDANGNILSERPENIINSYAVYSDIVKINYDEKTEYKNGKIGHIYRPEIIDATGKMIYGILDISNEILSIEIPLDFLETAIYPIFVDPTVGYTSIGATTYDIVQDAMIGSIFVAPEDGHLLNGYVYHRYGGSGSYSGKILLLDSLFNIINFGNTSLYCYSAWDWYSQAFPTCGIYSGITYYIGLVAAYGQQLRYDTGGSGGFIDSSNSFSSPTNPTDATTNDYNFSLYFTYAATLSDNVETISITENLNIDRNNERDIDKSESIGITENLGILCSDPEIQFDILSISENVSLVIEREITVNDSQPIIDGIGYFDDLIFINENVSVNLEEGPGNINISDDISIIEDILITVGSTGDISVNDTITITENNTLVNSTLGDILVSDLVSISEDNTFSTGSTLSISIVDDLTITENILQVISDLTLFINDSINILENVINENTTLGSINVYDTHSISESITSNSTISDILINDQITINENIGNVFSDLSIYIVVESLTILELLQLSFVSVGSDIINDMTLIKVSGIKLIG
jgi:hypothetical protein